MHIRSLQNRIARVIPVLSLALLLALLLQQHLDRREVPARYRPPFARRHMVGEVQRRLLGHLQTALEEDGLDVERVDHALEPERHLQHQGQRARRQDRFRGRRCGRHLYGLMAGQVHVRSLQNSEGRRQLERS